MMKMIILQLAAFLLMAACEIQAAGPPSANAMSSFPKLMELARLNRAARPEVKQRASKVELSGPARLDKPDTRYILTADVSAPGTAFVIAASRVTLDLNGRKTVYGTAGDKPSHGVLVEGYNHKDIQITGGRIVQAPGMENRKEAAGSTAVSVPRHVSGVDISHLDIEYNSPQTSGIHLAWGDGAIHHNVVTDKGSAVLNRHQQVSAINAHRAANTRVTENAVIRTRQTGIAMAERNTLCALNAVFIDSQSTNSFGVFYYGEKKPVENPWTCRDNAVKGVGVHPIGIGVVSAASNGVVEGNETETLCTRTSSEYGNKPIGAIGFRTTWGADKIIVRGNTFLVWGAKGSVNGYDAWGRAMMIALQRGNVMVVEKNTVKALSADPSVKVAGLAVTGGNESPGLVFKGNDVESTWAAVLLGDDYGGAGAHPGFYGNTFRKAGGNPDFKWVRDDYPDYPSTGFFAGNTLKGVSPQDFELIWKSAQPKELLFGEAYDFETTDQAGRPIPGRTVAVTGADGKELASGVSGQDGKLTLHVPSQAVGNVDEHGAVVRVRRTRELGPFKASSGGQPVPFAKGQAAPVVVVAGGNKP